MVMKLFGELMEIKETGVHPRGEPPIKKADGGLATMFCGRKDNGIVKDYLDVSKNIFR